MASELPGTTCIAATQEFLSKIFNSKLSLCRRCNARYKNHNEGSLSNNNI